MSQYDFLVSGELDRADTPFPALIMAAYRRADTPNQIKLEAGWPDIVDELRARYQTEGGYLPGEAGTQ